MEKIAADFHAVRAQIHRHVVEQLEMLVLAGDEGRRVAHRAVLPGRRNLRIADITRVAGDAEQSHLAGEIGAAIEAGLSAADVHPAESHFVQNDAAEHMGVCGDEVARARRERSAESRHQGSWSALVPNGWSSSASKVLNRANS